MVLAILFESLFPAHRGLVRNDERIEKGDGLYLHEPFSPKKENLTETSADDIIEKTPKVPSRRAATRVKRKRFKASKCLSSVTSDIDVITDWLYYASVISNRKTADEDARTPELLCDLLLASCIMGTLTWLMIATDAYFAKPILNRLGYSAISMGLLEMVNVLVEDLPQVILTFFIENYGKDYLELGPLALLNVFASIYDLLIKLAEAFDERMDYVETGNWCKYTIEAHPNRTVTSVIPVTRDAADEGSIKFISTSGDDTIKLWKVPLEENGNETFRPYSKQDGNGISCIVYVGKLSAHQDGLCLLSGHDDGTVTRWIIEKKSRIPFEGKEARGIGNEASRVTCIEGFLPQANDEYKYFLTGYQNGKAGLWNVESLLCLKIFQELDFCAPIHSISSLRNERQFATGSDCIRIWNVEDALKTPLQVPDPQKSLTNSLTDIACMTEPDNILLREGSNARVRSLKSLFPGRTLLSGYDDGRVIMWDVKSGALLRVLDGHTGSVTSLATVDLLTVLTGSDDKSIKIWDIDSQKCIRTYKDEHTEGITSLSIIETTRNGGNFCSSSKDGTVKIWNISSIPHHSSSGGLLGTSISKDEIDDKTLQDMVADGGGCDAWQRCHPEIMEDYIALNDAQNVV